MDTMFRSTLIKIGPELLSSASLENPGVKMFLSNYFGGLANDQLLKMGTDGAPELMSKAAGANYFQFFPAGVSFGVMDHYRQLICSGRFCRRDRYDGKDPEDYDLKKIKPETKITLITGQADLLASPVDYNKLYTQLKEQGVAVEQDDFAEGHLALVMPADLSVT